MRDQFEQTSAPSVQWMSPADIRKTGSRRSLRSRAVAAATLVVFGGGFLSLSNHDTEQLTISELSGPRSYPPSRSCSADPPAVLAEEREVKIILVVSPAQPGLAVQLSEALNQRGFRRPNVISADPVEYGFTRVKGESGTMLRYGGSEAGAAWLLRAYLRSDVVLSYSPSDDTDGIELTVGPEFQSFATPTEMRQLLPGISPPPNISNCGFQQGS